MTSPTMTVDPDVNALYIRFSNNEVAETIELSDTVYIDISPSGEPVGLEILNADPLLLATVPALPETANLRDLLSRELA